MTKKDDLIAEAKALGVELDSNETVADLEAKIGRPKADLEIKNASKGRGPLQIEGQVTRAKVNRGSRRRIERAITSLNKELDAAIKELDLQAFVADEDGNRTGEWPAVIRLREAKAALNDDVNQLLAG